MVVVGVQSWWLESILLQLTEKASSDQRVQLLDVMMSLVS